MRKRKTKGFKWSGFARPVSQDVSGYHVIGGNFVMELVLPNALKLDDLGFSKLRSRLEKYKKSHGGRWPDHISCSKRQLAEYLSIFPRPVGQPAAFGCTFDGVPLKVRKP